MGEGEGHSVAGEDVVTAVDVPGEGHSEGHGEGHGDGHGEGHGDGHGEGQGESRGAKSMTVQPMIV